MVDPTQRVAPPASLSSPPAGRASPLGSPGPSTGRVVFLDLLRLFAAVQMIQGHTLDALLAESLRGGGVFEVWTFVRGLTSVAFLLAAGFSFALACSSPRASRGDPARRRRRALILIALGYAMHAPLGILLGDPPREALADFAMVDVLQCIGVSLLLMEGLSSLVSSRRHLMLLSAALSTLCFAFGPLTTALAPSGPARLLQNYLTAEGGSIFPLVPWAGIVFAGLSAGLWLAPSLRAGRAHEAAPRLGSVGLVLAAGGALGVRLGPRFPAHVSPAYFGLKLGLVLLFCALLVRCCEGRVRLPPVLRSLTSETLFLYVSHVLVLYAGHVGLAHVVGRTQPLGVALFVAFSLLALCSLGALGYRRVARSLQARGGRGTPRPQPPLPPG